MKFTRIAVYFVVILFAASICCTNHTPPTPHISGPDSGFVNVPVEFAASYPDGSGSVSTLWYWDGTRSTSTTFVPVANHTYADTGVYLVWAKGFWGITNGFDYTTWYWSEPSNICTLRILPAPARPAKP